MDINKFTITCTSDLLSPIVVGLLCKLIVYYVNLFISINRANSTLYIYYSTLMGPVSHSQTSSLRP